jgi:RNA polymerase sigma factor (TIGR02999 family)
MKRERVGNSLQPTALVNEAYLRLVDIAEVHCQDRVHFFALSAQLMRRILVDAARAGAAAKRGRQAQKAAVNLEEIADASLRRGNELIAVDDALTALAQIDARKARVIELRFFSGLSVEESAEVLGVSPETVMRDWKMARAWLTRELQK